MEMVNVDTLSLADLSFCASSRTNVGNGEGQARPLKEKRSWQMFFNLYKTNIHIFYILRQH